MELSAEQLWIKRLVCLVGFKDDLQQRPHCVEWDVMTPKCSF